LGPRRLAPQSDIDTLADGQRQAGRTL